MYYRRLINALLGVLASFRDAHRLQASGRYIPFVDNGEHPLVSCMSRAPGYRPDIGVDR
jgi:hypothetical protein